MKTANVADFKSHFSRFIALVEQGETVQVCKRNVPVARVVPAAVAPVGNRTVLGCGIDSVHIKCDLTEPSMAAEDWEMLD